MATALAAVLLIGGGSVAVAGATQGHILDLIPGVQSTHTNDDDDEQCKATPAAGHECEDNDKDEQCKATPAAGHECEDNDHDEDDNCKATPAAGHECEDNDKGEHGNGQNGKGTPTP